MCFGTGVHTAPLFICSVWWAPEDEHVNHTRSPFYSPVLFQDSGFLLSLLRECMSTPGAYGIGDTCVRVCVPSCMRACTLTPLLTTAFAPVGITRFCRTLRGQGLMKNMSDKIHGYQGSWWKWRGERGIQKKKKMNSSLFFISLERLGGRWEIQICQGVDEK